MNRRAFFLLILFGITFFILLFLSLFLLVKRHTQSKDSKFLTNLKLFLGLEQEKDSISQYFNNADKILKYFLKNSSNYKYELPWYISFGSARAGKTSFFSNVPLDTPVQLNYSDTAYINHYFFNEGIVLDIKSDLIFHDSSHNFSWDRLLAKLKDIRPMKCIDGIVYFVSLSDLLSKDPDVILQNKKDIEVLYQKLWKLQNKFEMRLPIYMVFTHLDALPGFFEFISLFNSYSSDIFGWSNPFSLDAKFSVDLLNNMKTILDEELKVLLAEVMVNFPAEISFNIMNFINSFQDVYPIISEHLSLIFQNNKYTSGLYLRGVYFTAIDSQTSSFEKIPYLKNEDADLEGGHTIVQSNIFFAKDLLVKKIFAEKNIGKDSVDKKIVSKQLKLLQLSYSAFSIAALSYSASLYRDLTFVQESLFPKYLKISDALHEYDSDKNYVNRRGFIEELKLLLLYLGDASNYRLFFTGVPSSYFSSVDHSKVNLILLASKKLVLTTLFNEIESKFVKLSNSSDFNYTVTSETYSFINPLHSNEFHVLKEIVSIVAEIEQYEQKFISFKEHNSVSSLGWLLENILNIKMPESFEKNIMHSSKMDLVDLDLSKMFNHKKKIRKKFRLYLNKFIINCFSKDKISQYFFELERLLFLIDSTDDKLSYDNLQSLQKYISDLVTLFNDSEFDWLKSKHFSSKEFDSLLKDIESSSLLGGEDTVTELLNRTSTSYHSFKNSLGCYQLPLIGSPFYTIDNFKIQLSQSILELQGVLNDIFSESFMERVPKKSVPNLNISHAIFWDVQSIKNILGIIKDYNIFESKIFSQSTSSKIDLIVGRIAQKNLRDLIQFKMLDSHKVVGLNLNNAHLADFADNVKNTFEEISEIFKFLSKIDVDFFRDLKDLQKSSLLNFLTYIDRAMQMENLYDIKEDNFLLDSNNKKLYFNFNLNDYLSSQKKHIEFFSGILTTYVLAGLDNIAFLDNTISDPLVIKWKDIAKNLEDYKSNTSNSQLFLLEEFTSKIQRSPLNDLFQKDLKKIEANLNKDSFFETKLFILTQRLNNVLNSSISRLLVVQYEVALAFYKEYSYAFPFDMNGPLIGVAGYNKMQDVIKKQQEIINLVHMIKPNYDSPVFRFVANLGKLSRMISFLMSSEECLILNFKAYQSIGDLYEKNLNLVVGCSAKVNGQKPLNLYKNGQIKIYDVVEFEISLAKNCGKKISKINKNGYLISSNSFRLSFDKYQLMSFLMENTVEVNHSLFIRFTIEIEDDKGIKDSIVIMIPVELCLDGVKFEMPDKSFTKISEE